MKTLHLTLKKKWFDMILSGEKKEEYRELKEYWWMRLVECGVAYVEGKPLPIEQWQMIMSKSYDAISFTNGYGSDKPNILMEFKGIEIGIGKKEWGAPDGEVFKIKVGEILERKNIK